MSRNATLLIIDDETELLEMYREFLEMEGFNVLTALSGKKGLELFEAHRDSIQLIISDAKLDDISGMEILKRIREKYQTVPVFYLSTGALDTTEKTVREMGGSRLILKPFDLDEILIKIKEDLNL